MQEQRARQVARQLSLDVRRQGDALRNSVAMVPAGKLETFLLLKGYSIALRAAKTAGARR